MNVSFKDLPPKAKAITSAVLALLVAIIMLSLTVLPNVVQQMHQQKVQTETAQLAKDYATALNQHLKRLNADLESELKRQAAADALAAGDVQAVTATISARLDQLHTLKIVPAQANLMGFDLRFTQIERINNAKAGLQSEAFTVDNTALFDVIAPVKTPAGDTVGYAVAVFNTDVLNKALTADGKRAQNITLTQQFATGRAQTFYQSAKSADNKATATEKTSVPHWELGVVPGPALAMSSVSQYSVMGLQIGSILISLLVLFLLVKKFQPVYTVMEPVAPKKAIIKPKAEVAVDNADAAPVAEDLPAELIDADLSLDELDDLDLEIRPAVEASSAVNLALQIPAHIFRDYDIRGVAETDLSDNFAKLFGQAFASECLSRGENTIVLAGDGRLSTPRLKALVKEGMLAAGAQVIDIGLVPTPVMYFATNTMAGVRSGVMVTASHNPPEDNGFKMVISGDTLTAAEIQKIKQRMERDDVVSGIGESRDDVLLPKYIDYIVNDIVLAGSYRVVVDAANGIAAKVAPQLLEELGCDVISLNCEIDGNFPAHEPDPSNPANLQQLVDKVREEDADLGIALDGDGDRLSVVTAAGDIILPDRLLMLFAKDIVARNPGVDVVYDVKCTRALSSLIAGLGGRPVMWKSGHSHIKQKMKETNALLGGELSGHIFFKERWFGFDDGVYAAARLLEIMSIRAESLDDIFSMFPQQAMTPEIRVPCAEHEKFHIIEQLASRGQWGNGRATDIDGVRIDFAKGWGLVRASNTQAALTLRFEADDEATLDAVQQVFKQQLTAVAPSLSLPF